MSVQVKGGAEAALDVVRRVQAVHAAPPAWAGPESLIEHRASVEGPESRTPPGLLRLSIGLEHAGGPGRGSRPGAPRRGYSAADRLGLDSSQGALGAPAAISSLISSSIIFLSFGTAALAAGPISAERDRDGEPHRRLGIVERLDERGHGGSGRRAHPRDLVGSGVPRLRAPMALRSATHSVSVRPSATGSLAVAALRPRARRQDQRGCGKRAQDSFRHAASNEGHFPGRDRAPDEI